MRQEGRRFSPIIAPILEQRMLLGVLTGAGLLQILVVSLGMHGWPCPFKAVFKIPCPGCGISSAAAAFLSGRWSSALEIHLFAPLFLFGLALAMVINMLPEPSHRKVVDTLAKWEAHTGLFIVVLIGFAAYWGMRLVV